MLCMSADRVAPMKIPSNITSPSNSGGAATIHGRYIRASACTSGDLDITSMIIGPSSQNPMANSTATTKRQETLYSAFRINIKAMLATTDGTQLRKR